MGGTLCYRTARGVGDSPRDGTPCAAALLAAPAALVDLLHGLNMVLLRIGFELLRRSGFVRWLRNLIQVRY